MIELSLTTKEAVRVESELDLLSILLNPKISSEMKLKLLDRELSPEVKNAHEKLKAELDNLAQAQRMLLEQPDPRANLTPEEFITLTSQQIMSMGELPETPK
jgi:hypothetical protein